MTASEKTRALAKKLERGLTRNGIGPGWRFPPEERLAEMHGVSRSAVRAALSILRGKGLIASRRGGGNFVATVNPAVLGNAVREHILRTETEKSFNDLLSLRMLIEGECARELAGKSGTEATAKLRGAFQEMLRRAENPAAFAQADHAFHRTLVGESSNGLFRVVMDSLSGFAELYTQHSHTVVRGRTARVLAEHEAILEAIEQGDGDAAAHLAYAHVQRAKANLNAARK